MNFRNSEKMKKPNKINLKNIVDEACIEGIDWCQNYLDLDENTLITLGLLEAEMTKSGGGNNMVFTNSEPLAINQVINWFQEKFNVSKDGWNWLIQFNANLTSCKDYLDVVSREYASYLFWVKNTVINKQNCFPKWIVYCRPEKKLTTKSKWGTLRIYYGNLSLRNVVLKVLEEFKKKIYFLNQKELALYLNGLFCGDGGANF